MGCSEWRIFIRHIIPNVLPLVVVIMSGALGGAILAESALAFSTGPAEASWGRDIAGTACRLRARVTGTSSCSRAWRSAPGGAWSEPAGGFAARHGYRTRGSGNSATRRLRLLQSRSDQQDHRGDRD